MCCFNILYYGQIMANQCAFEMLSVALFPFFPPSLRNHQPFSLELVHPRVCRGCHTSPLQVLCPGGLHTSWCQSPGEPRIAEEVRHGETDWTGKTCTTTDLMPSGVSATTGLPQHVLLDKPTKGPWRADTWAAKSLAAMWIPKGWGMARHHPRIVDMYCIHARIWYAIGSIATTRWGWTCFLYSILFHPFIILECCHHMTLHLQSCMTFVDQLFFVPPLWDRLGPSEPSHVPTARRVGGGTALKFWQGPSLNHVGQTKLHQLSHRNTTWN